MSKTKEQQAQEYVLNRQTARHNAKTEEEATMADFDKTRKVWDAYDMEQAFEDGYTACEQSQWRSVEEELPEDDRLVLAHFSDVDPELSYATAYYKDGAWQTPDDWYYDCKIDFWMPIPPIHDTNTEKK